MKNIQIITINIYYLFRRIKLFIPNLLFKNKKHKYLFILSPPFCGSTLLNEIISTSKKVSCNNNIGTREGQTLPRGKDIMFTKERWNPNLELPWEHIKKIWKKYWNLSKPILLEKSVPNILRVKEIKNTFLPVSFICMVRDPYAQCEGIMRRNNVSAEEAAKFSIHCLMYQKNNIENEKKLLFFTYEDLCDNTEKIIERIQNLLPELNDINIKKNFSAHNFKGKRKMRITNLNNEKIKKLTIEDITSINHVFSKNKNLLEYFNYSIINKI